MCRLFARHCGHTFIEKADLDLTAVHERFSTKSVLTISALQAYAAQSACPAFAHFAVQLNTNDRSAQSRTFPLLST